jgi:hypothetical protein
MTAPRYQEVKAVEIPEAGDDAGTRVKVVCGTFWGKTGPVEGIAADPIVFGTEFALAKIQTYSIAPGM